MPVESYLSELDTGKLQNHFKTANSQAMRKKKKKRTKEQKQKRKRLPEAPSQDDVPGVLGTCALSTGEPTLPTSED